ncbi:hypothetical protein RJT34_16966 [Clitoria ternatea]|uniref:Uncharacterized protein n=1 Tax=Clitoria ternatea TaxID=43366 RepID=A0AAN9J8E6_CLITE
MCVISRTILHTRRCGSEKPAVPVPGHFACACPFRVPPDNPLQPDEDDWGFSCLRIPEEVKKGSAECSDRDAASKSGQRV